MTPTIIQKAANRAHDIDETIQMTLKRQERHDRRFRFWCYITLTVLLLVGIGGIYKQNTIANQNKQHIDCIVKLFTTPLPTGAKSRVITDAETACNIKFIQ